MLKPVYDILDCGPRHRFWANGKLVHNSNWLNFKRGSDIRRSIMAPEGYLLGPVDASQIECLAEGQLVITNRGCVPIEKISVDDFVWDGIGWVRHQGVVFKGEQDVVEFDGLTATPNHIIYTKHFPHGITMGNLSIIGRQNAPLNCAPPICKTSLRSEILSGLQDIWSTWRSLQIQYREECYVMGSFEFASSDIYRTGNRSHRQRRALRTWKFTVINTTCKCKQSLYYVLGAVWVWATCYARFQARESGVRIWQRSNQSLGGAWPYRRTDYSTLQKRSLERHGRQGTWSAGEVQARNKTKKAKVYDIVNAGPKHRFMLANGMLVANCRVLNYLAGQEDVVENFRKKRDPYVALASACYGEEIYKPEKGDPRKEEMEQKRGMGKQGELMCGYGAAGAQFARTAKNGLYGPPVILSAEEANRFVEVYRSTHPQVIDYWKTSNRIIARLAGGPPMEWGPFLVKDHKFILPSGQAMNYESLEFHKPDEDEQCREFEEKGYWRMRVRRGYKKMWGSKLAQNICEMVSRVIVSQAMIRIKRKYGIRTLNWPYDELLLLIPDNSKSEETLELCRQEMCQTPSWLPGLPLDAESSLGVRYSK